MSAIRPQHRPLLENYFTYPPCLLQPLSLQKSAKMMHFSFPRLATATAVVLALVPNTLTQPSKSSFSCPNTAPGPVSTFDLAQSFLTPVLTDASSVEAIRQTLAIYPLAIDGRNFEALRKVFTTDVRANYSDPIGALNGVQAVIDTLAPRLL